MLEAGWSGCSPHGPYKFNWFRGEPLVVVPCITRPVFGRTRRCVSQRQYDVSPKTPIEGPYGEPFCGAPCGGPRARCPGPAEDLEIAALPVPGAVGGLSRKISQRDSLWESGGRSSGFSGRRGTSHPIRASPDQ